MTIERNIFATLITLLTMAFFTAASAAEKQLEYARAVPLVATSRTTVGETISYPRGTAKITSAIVTLEPGESTGFHKHGVPTYGYILSGAVTVDYGTHGKRTYQAGTAFMEAMEVWHDGTNDGPAPCRILVVFMGSDKSANVIKQ
jgi:quercetin dioxygenase-like cupin family protein